MVIVKFQFITVVASFRNTHLGMHNNELFKFTEYS